MNDTNRYKPAPPLAEWLEIKPIDVDSSEEMQKFREEQEKTSPEIANQVVTRLARKAAAESVAVEGFYELKPGESRTIAVEQEGWEEIIEAHSRESLGLFIAQLDAFEYVRDAANRRDDFVLTEAFIRETHALSCKNQETYLVYTPGPAGTLMPSERPLQHGQYKEFPNNVTQRNGETHYYCDPVEVPIEMGTLIEECQTEAFANLHPTIKAAYIHYAITHIHPFSDGNGRTARAIASLYTYQGYKIPLIVYADRKLTYLQALESADRGRYFELVEYVADRAINTLSHAAQEYRSIASPGVGDLLSELLKTATVHGDVTLEQYEEIADKLRQVVEEKFMTKVNEIIETSDGKIDYAKPASGNYTSLEGGYSPTKWIHAEFTVKHPIIIRKETYLLVGYATDLSNAFPFEVVASRNPNISMLVRPLETVKLKLEDVYPNMGSDAIDRIDMLIELACSDVINEIMSQMRHALRQAGQLNIDL